MTELQIIISNDLKFTVECKNSESNEVLNKILKNFNKSEDIVVRYWSEEELDRVGRLFRTYRTKLPPKNL